MRPVSRLQRARLPCWCYHRRALLLRGRYSFAFAPPTNGTLIIHWATASRAGGQSRTLAHGHADFLRGHRGPVAVVLTGAGRRALAQAVTITVRATATFTPIAPPAVTASRSFTLTR